MWERFVRQSVRSLFAQFLKMEQHSTVPTHRRQSSDPPGGFDFASVLQQFGNEEMKVEEGELMTKDGICFKTVAAAALEAAAATGEVIDKSILENELWRTMNEGANNKRSRVEEWGAGAAASGRRNRSTMASSWEESFIASGVDTGGGAIQRKRPLIPKVVSESSDSHDDPHPKPSPAARGMRGSYKCSRCGQKKSNHVCTAVSSLSVSVGMQTVALVDSASTSEAMWPSLNDDKFVHVGGSLTSTATLSSSSAATAAGAGAGAATSITAEFEINNPP